MRGQLFDENKLITDLKEELDKRSKELKKYKSDNAYMVRTKEKDKIFLQSKDQKELDDQEQKNNGLIDFYLKKLTELSIELEFKKDQFDDLTQIKELDMENIELIVPLY